MTLILILPWKICNLCINGPWKNLGGWLIFLFLVLKWLKLFKISTNKQNFHMSGQTSKLFYLFFFKYGGFGWINASFSFKFWLFWWVFMMFCRFLFYFYIFRFWEVPIIDLCCYILQKSLFLGIYWNFNLIWWKK